MFRPLGSVFAKLQTKQYYNNLYNLLIILDFYYKILRTKIKRVS